MRLTIAAAFQADAQTLAADERARLFDVLLALPEAFREPGRHAGLGLRKLHSSGIWEARLGLGLRLILALAQDELVLVRVATHDEVRRYLRQL